MELCQSGALADVYANVSEETVAATLVDQAPIIAREISVVLAKYRYQIGLEANRHAIDTALSAFYGDSVYMTRVSPVVDQIFALVRDAISKKNVKGQAGRYVDPNQFAVRLIKLPATEWNKRAAELLRTQKCAKEHRDTFPMYRNGMLQSILFALYMYGSVALFVGFLVFLIACYSGYSNGTIKMHNLVQRVLVGISVFVILLVIAETTVGKHRVTSDHNYNAIDTNGEALVGSIIAAHTSIAELRDAPDEIKRKASAAFNNVKQSVEYFDRCNFITSAQPSIPFPVVDVVMFAIIALIIMAVAGLVVGRMDPGGKVDNIRRLLKMRGRLRRGEFATMGEGGMGQLLRTIECCEPPDFVWSMFMWFAIIALFITTWWFVFVNQDAVDDYAGAIDAEPDCV